MTDRMNEPGPTGGRTLGGDMGGDVTIGGGPMGEHAIDDAGGTGAGVLGGGTGTGGTAGTAGGPDLPDHADSPELLGGPGDGLTAERRSRA